MLRLKKLCLANGDEFGQTELYVDAEVLYDHMVIAKTEGKTIYANIDYILSMEEDTNPDVIFSSRRRKEKQ